MKRKLDSLEKKIEKEANEYVMVSDSKRKKIETLIDTAKKVKNINIRISENDVSKLREVAAKEGLPYQTLISSIIHKYVTGQLVDEKNILKAVRILKAGSGEKV